MNPIGIMQGRLLPPIDGRLQAFPVGRCFEEFALAAEAGLDRIEWIYELETAEVNPLATDQGIAQIRRAARDNRVEIRSVCADYFMRSPLVARAAFSEAAGERLRWLLQRCAALGVEYIVLPFVDDSALRGAGDVTALIMGLKGLFRDLGRFDVALHLETALPPAELRALLSAVDHPLVRATYDIGNSASLGFPPDEELPAIGPWLGSVHVKDRLHGGGSVPLGTGDADLEASFRLLAQLDYRGPFILQAARDPARSEVELAQLNREFVVRRWAAARASGGART